MKSWTSLKTEHVEYNKNIPRSKVRMNKVLDSTKYVVDHSACVSIKPEAVKRFSDGFAPGNSRPFLSDMPLDISKLSEEQKLNFLLVFSSQAFSFWGEPKWTVEFEGKKLDGSYGMVLAIKRALAEGKAVLDPKYRAAISREDFSQILQANTEIPLLDERLKIFVETGRVLEEKFGGGISNLLRGANHDVLTLLELIADNFSSYRDASEFMGRKVYFFKRLQYFVSEIYETFDGKGWGQFQNIGELTACADYKLPQVLRKFGVLEYEKKLADKIDKKVPLIHNSEEEIEIRANSIWAVEYIKEQLKKRMPNITSTDINDHLWLYTQIKRPEDKPYHLCRTTAY